MAGEYWVGRERVADLVRVFRSEPAAPAAGNHTFLSVTDRAANAAMGAGFQIGTRGANLDVWAIGGTVYLFAAAPTANAWHHLVYTFDGTNHRMYVDGAQAMASTVPAPRSQAFAPAEAIIGNYLNGNEFFTGQIDDVRIWKNRVLTQAEISALLAGQ